MVAVAHSHVATDRGWTPAYRGKRRRGLRNGPWLASPAPTQQRPASLDLGRLQALCIGRQCRPRPALREPNAATAHARAPSICAGRDGMRRQSIIDETTTDTHETYLFNTYGNQVIYLFIFICKLAQARGQDELTDRRQTMRTMLFSCPSSRAPLGTLTQARTCRVLELRLLQISRAIDRRSAVVADVVDVAADETLYLFIYIYLFFRRRPGFASCAKNEKKCNICPPAPA